MIKMNRLNNGQVDRKESRKLSERTLVNILEILRKVKLNIILITVKIIEQQGGGL